MTQSEYSLLNEYWSLETEKEREQFLKDNPGLAENKRDTWLEEHPKENAQLAIRGQAKVLTQAAYDEAQTLIKRFDIPDSAIRDYLPPKDIVKQYFAVPETRRDEISGMSAEIADQFVEYCNAYYSGKTGATTAANKIRAKYKYTLEKYMIDNGYWTTPVKSSSPTSTSRSVLQIR